MILLGGENHAKTQVSVSVLRIALYQLAESLLGFGEAVLVEIDNSQFVAGPVLPGREFEHPLELHLGKPVLPGVEVGVGESKECGSIVGMLADRGLQFS